MCSAIATFMVSFVALVLWSLFALKIETIWTLFLVVGIVSFILAYIAYLLDTVSFIFITAFGGALIASIGFYEMCIRDRNRFNNKA